MSKISTHPEKKANSKVKQGSDEKFAYRSVIISVILGGIFLTISIFFNINIITIFEGRNILWDIIDVLIKTVTTLLFFFFMMVSIGNYQELVGKPINWKEILLLFVLSLCQTILNPWVFTLTLFGLLFILIYFYLVQES
ncbi:MAG: hypothetical protein ACFE9T_15955 [Promethearchaeota archaeon]